MLKRWLEKMIVLELLGKISPLNHRVAWYRLRSQKPEIIALSI